MDLFRLLLPFGREQTVLPRSATAPGTAIDIRKVPGFPPLSEEHRPIDYVLARTPTPSLAEQIFVVRAKAQLLN